MQCKMAYTDNNGRGLVLTVTPAGRLKSEVIGSTKPSEVLRLNESRLIAEVKERMGYFYDPKNGDYVTQQLLEAREKGIEDYYLVDEKKKRYSVKHKVFLDPEQKDEDFGRRNR